MALFWTDGTQAKERLEGTYLMLGDDPVYILSVDSGHRPPMAYIANYRTGERNIAIDVAALGDCRKIPPLGWINLRNLGNPHAVYTERLPYRGRRHGLNPDGLRVADIVINSGGRNDGWTIDSIFSDKGYLDCVDGKYPSLQEILERLPMGMSTAFSRRNAVLHDKHGMMWLYRRSERIGLLSKDRLQLFPKFSFVTDELLESNIQEVVQIVEL